MVIDISFKCHLSLQLIVINKVTKCLNELFCVPACLFTEHINACIDIHAVRFVLKPVHVCQTFVVNCCLHYSACKQQLNIFKLLECYNYLHVSACVGIMSIVFLSVHEHVVCPPLLPALMMQKNKTKKKAIKW